MLGDAVFVGLNAAALALGTSHSLPSLFVWMHDLEGSMRMARGISDKRALSRWPMFAAASVAYLVLITKGVTFMEDRKPFVSAKRLLPFWSLIAWLFSFIVTVRCCKALAQHYHFAKGDSEGYIEGLNTAVTHYCKHVDEILATLTGFPEKLAWVNIFVYSKPFEFIDTIFLVLLKKEVTRLHWWHHIITMWFTWFNLVLFASPGVVFATVNASVHTIMYCWYFLASIGLKPRMSAIVVTAIQNAQMVLGVFIPLYFYSFRHECYIPDIYWVTTLAMYGLYVYLFGSFFFTKHITTKNKKKNGVQAGGDVSENKTACTGGISNGASGIDSNE